MGTAPPGWEPDPAWGPAPEGWELWVEDDDTGTVTAPAPTGQGGSATSASVGGQGPSWGQGNAQGGNLESAASGTWTKTPAASPGQTSGGKSKLPWILGAVIALLLVVLLILAVMLFRSPGGSGSQSTSQSGASGGSAGDFHISEEATEINVDPEGATEIGDLGEPVETFNQDDDDIELPTPDGEDAPQLLTLEVKGDGFMSMDGEHADGSDAFIPLMGSSILGDGEPEMHLIRPASGGSGNPVTKLTTDDDVDFELKVYSIENLKTIEGGSAKGNGDSVFLLKVDEPIWYKGSHNGEHSFEVRAAVDYEDGTYGEVETENQGEGRSVSYSKFTQGLWLVEVSADGKWSLEESTQEMAEQDAVQKVRDDDGGPSSEDI